MSRFNPLLAGLACAGLFPTAAQADDRPELRIGVVSSVTGGASAIATGAVAAINLMEERTAADASLPFRVSFIKYDDGSDPARAVNATRKLIRKIASTVICCTTTPASLAVNKVIEEERVPNLSLAAAASVIEPADAHRFTFKTPLTDRLMIDHTVDYMVKQGWKQVAFMGLEDSYGEGGWVEFKQIATRKGLEIVAAERFSRGDTNFTPQALRVSQKKPDAVYFHAIPPSSALATETLRRVGYRVRCCMAPARPRRPSWRSARRRSKARWSAPRPCPCIASCPTTIRSSPASPRSCRPMTASTAPARPTCSRPRPTTRCRSRCWPIAGGCRRQGRRRRRPARRCATPSRRRASIAASTACSATARPTTWAWTGAAPSW